LGKYCQIDSGFAFKSAQFTKNGNDICLVKGSNLSHRKIDWEDAPRWSSNEFDQLARYELVFGDVVVAMDRPIVGGNLKFAWIQKSDPKALLVQRVARLRARNGLDQKYLRFVIADPAFKAYIDTITTGVNVPHISGPDMRRYKFPLPPLPTQQKIAQILSAYDDLIENNLKRIKLLEEMAQITYEQWFVRLKFPNHETTPINAKTGLPEGWKELTLGEACNVSGGGTPSKAINEYWDNGDIPWFSPTDLSKANSLILLDSTKKITQKGLLKSSAKLMSSDSFMMSSRATIGLFGIIDTEFTTNQGFINITPNKKEHKNYLLFNFKSRVQEFYNHASGATFAEISKTNFKRLKIYWPSDEILLLWNNSIDPVIKSMSNLTKQNQRLKEARDILLPRLMTGIIDVDKIKIPSLKADTESKNA